MRELFDEMAGRSPLDPQEAVRQAARKPQRKRFYKEAGVAEAEGGFAITLDGKPIRTPSGRQVVIPSRAMTSSKSAYVLSETSATMPLWTPRPASRSICSPLIIRSGTPCFLAVAIPMSFFAIS